MQSKIDHRPIQAVETDTIIMLGFEKDSRPASEFARAVNEATGGWLDELYRTGEFAGKFGETAFYPRPAGFAARRLMAIGCGKPDKFTPAEMRKTAGAALRALKSRSCREAALALETPFAGEDFASAALEGAILGDFEPDRYKTDEKEKRQFDVFSVVAAASEDLLRRAQVVAESQNFARALVNEPGNRLTPSTLAARAREMADEAGLECEILDQDRMRQLGMGALLAVAQGSAEPPALVVLRYRPQAASGAAHLGLVGKGVTFDSGGISIKPGDGMEKMRYDMAGAAAVLGALRALARLKPPIAVTAVAPLVENMPGGRAQRPGDIVTTLAGKTVEVINTDAEGRLILADALTYARRLGCTRLVDAATLTGAVVVALGHVNVGVFSNDDPLRDRVLAAARAEGEKMWPMPLDEEYKDQLKSAFADLPNVGNRWGGAITAAIFLKEFVEDTPWVHLDIAGTAWIEEAKPFLAKGPSGIGVRTLVELAMSWRD